MTSSPFAGIRVVSVEQAVAAPYCTRQMADLGAEVIKVERPGNGDFARGYDDFVHGWSTQFVWLNRGKRSISLDFSTPDGREILRRLIASADVLVVNLSRKASERVLDVARSIGKRGLITCAITGYGPTSPHRDRKAFDSLIQGEAGVVWSTGTSEHRAKAGVSLADLGTGTMAFAAIASALYRRERTGEGAELAIGLFDLVADWMSPQYLIQSHRGSVPEPVGMHHSSIAPYGPFECADGRLVNLAVQNEQQWRRLCLHVLEDRSFADDPSFVGNAARVDRRSEVDARIAAYALSIPSRTFEERLDAADVPWGRINTMEDVLAHPHLEEDSRWVSVGLGDGSDARCLAGPIRIDGASPVSDGVPVAGADTESILEDLGYDSQDIVAMHGREVI